MIAPVRGFVVDVDSPISSSLFDTFDISMQNYCHSMPSSTTSSSMSPKCDNGADLRPNDVIGPPRHSSSLSRSATKRKNLRVLTVNCQSLRCHSKHLEIAMLVQKYNPDAVNTTEIHLNMEFTNSELGQRGYDIIRCDIVGGMGPWGRSVSSHTARPTNFTNILATYRWS